jgi:hypothetical protein
VKTKIICLTMVLAMMLPAILVPSLASATGCVGTAVPRVLSLIVEPASGVNIHWPDDVVLGGYYYNSEAVVIKNNGNVICDIELRGANAVIAVGGYWQLQQTIVTPPEVNRYNLAWFVGAYGPAIWLHSVNYTKIYDDVSVGNTRAGFLQMRTPAVGSTFGAFTIATDFRAVPHSDKVSP